MHAEYGVAVAGSSRVMRQSGAAAVEPRPVASPSGAAHPAPPHAAPDAPIAALARVDGWRITLADLDGAVAAIAGAAERGESFSAVTLNLDHLVKLRRSEPFRRAYRAARFVTADGAPVARLARLTNSAITRTTGADLLVPLAEEAARRGIPVYLFGASGSVLATVGRALSVRSGGTLAIAGTDAPPQGFDPDSAAADAALDRIVQSGARLCFLALGAPKQEILAARAVARGLPVGFVSVGAALDFVAGAQTRAPAAMRHGGLEWLWRLATNPRRLALRYTQCALLLVDLTVLAPIRQRLGGGRPA